MLLDMDGTLLDLSYDNYIWRRHVPRVYARANGVDPATAIDAILGKYRAVRGTLEWYCLDHWRERLGVDVVQIHHDLKHRNPLPAGCSEIPARHAGQRQVGAAGDQFAPRYAGVEGRRDRARRLPRRHA